MLLVAVAAVVLNNYLFRLQMSLVAQTEVKQKHVYAVSREALVQRESDPDSAGLHLLQTPFVRLWELLSSSFPHFSNICGFLQYLQ